MQLTIRSLTGKPRTLEKGVYFPLVYHGTEQEMRLLAWHYITCGIGHISCRISKKENKSETFPDWRACASDLITKAKESESILAEFKKKQKKA